MAKSHIEIAKQLKQNSVEIKEYFEDLYKWQNEIKEKEEKEKDEKKKKNTNNCFEEKELLKKRDESIINSTKKNLKKNNNSLKRDCHSIDSYYKAWDQLKLDDSDNDSNDNDFNDKYYNDRDVTSINNYSIDDNKGNDEIKEDTNKTKCTEESINENNKNQFSHMEIDERNNVDTKKDVDYEINISKYVDNIRNNNIVKSHSKVYSTYFSKNEESKINYQNKKYNKCLENYNDIINYIDYELRNKNIFIEIEKNYDNEIYIEIISNNYISDKKIEELLVLRTKALVNRSLVYQKLSSYFESIKDCCSIILFYTYFLSGKKDCSNYSVKEYLTLNIRYIIFKAYYLRGMARYKLKVYKLSLKDFKNAKKLSDKLNYCKSIDIDKSITLIENIIKENNIKKHIRRQNEYTSTLLEQYKLTPRLLTIETIPKSSIKELEYFENKNTVDDKEEEKNFTELTENHTSDKNNDHHKKRIHKELPKNNLINDFIPNKSYNTKNSNKKFQEDDIINTCNSKEEKMENMKNKDKNFSNDHINYDSSLSISEKSILSDLDETKPLTLTLSNKKDNKKIKNKINFELLWNSNKIKKSFKNQIDILKAAFLEEDLFHFYSDKDIYVDILDALFKNKFLNLFENTQNSDEIKKHFNVKFKKDNSFNEITTCMEEELVKEKENTIKEVKQNIDEEEMNSNDCIILIDILYSMTNYGKENYVFLFIDKKERNLLLRFFNFILKYPNTFICNENCIKQKTLLLKNLLESVF